MVTLQIVAHHSGVQPGEVAGAAGLAAAIVTRGKAGGDGTQPPSGPNVTRSSLNRIKTLIRSLSRDEAKASPIGQEKVDKLQRIVEKAGGTLRNDGADGVKGSSAGIPHVQTEGLGNKVDSRHVWTERDVKLKDTK